LTGLVLGVGLYGYTSFRVAPLLVLVGVGLRWLALDRAAPDFRPQTRALLDHLAALVLVALGVFVPLLAYWVRYPHVFWLRVEAFGAGTGLESIWAALRGLAESLLMLSFGNDPVRLNVVTRPPIGDAPIPPLYPVLGPVMGALFLLGAAAWLWTALRARRPLAWFLPLALIVLVLPSALGFSRPDEMPSARRAITALPVVMVLGGAALVLPLRALRAWRPDAVRLRRAGWIAALVIGGAVLLLNGAVNLNAYFNTYADWYMQGSQPARAIAQQIRLFVTLGGELDNVYLVYGDQFGWVDPRAVSIWLGVPRHNLTINHVDALACPPRRSGGPLFFVLAYGDRNNLHRLGVCYDDLDAAEYMLPSHTGFTTVRVP
ncbi:MAG: hypothetical protein JW910_12710, partial [Anaerolineae bacterium]|nr:hypothetical protein [Anaerolineae bacterium]